MDRDNNRYGLVREMITLQDEVNKRLYGAYHLLYLDRSPQALWALEKSLRIDEHVLKWLSVAVADVNIEFEAFEKLKRDGSIAQTLTE